MPHLDTTTYMHSMITFWLTLTTLLLWNTKTQYTYYKKMKMMKEANENK
uniref:ATP synthase F0 subunit 8 n=1 Tax=Oopsacas minuta TaxID=111878 RepID=A0A0G3ZAT2_9METZ|nr:ATP synthase F0 subunit 8 [Oopsacas minuta]AKM54869.1 ATP synthase F0 subunit 8 [Oopsacas minuta]